MNTENSKRLTIGLQLPSLNNIYSRMILKGIHSALSKLDANLIIFSGETPNNPWMSMHYQESVIYDLINKKNLDALILPTAMFSNFCTQDELEHWINKFSDIPIVSLGMDLSKYCDNQSSLLIDNGSGLEVLITHLIEKHNYTNIAFLGGSKENQDAIERLNTYKRVLNKFNIEIDNNNIYYGNFAYSDGKNCVKEFLDNRNIMPQVIVCANDSGALGVMDELHKRGFSVPKDIAVTGFDNAKEAEYYIPPLSTVSQPLFEQGLKAGENAIKMATNQPIKETHQIETLFVNRQSCGCQALDYSVSNTNQHNTNSKKSDTAIFNKILNRIDYDVLSNDNVSKLILDVIDLFINGFDNIDSSNSEDPKSTLLIHFHERFQKDVKSGVSFEVWRTYFKKLETHIFNNKLSKEDALFFYQLKDSFSQSLICHLESHSTFNDRSYFFRNFMRMIFDARTFEQLSQLLTTELENLGIHSFYLSCFQNPVTHHEKSKWLAPESCQLINAFDQGKYNKFSEELLHYDSSLVLPEEYYPKDRRYSLVVESLYLSGDQLGRICYEWSIKDSEMLSNLMLNGQISAAIKNIHMYNEQNRIQATVNNLMNNLTKMNTQLENQSKTDELTELLNRRGFIDKSTIMLRQAKELKQDCKLMFLDLDGLKIINDSFGHQHGDTAIKEFANILSRVFRKNDAISRFGGDEFVILATNITSDLMNKKIEMIQSNINDFNDNNKETWTLGASMGFVGMDHNKDQSLSTLLSQADQILYEQKRLKKNSRLV